jgi:UDP-glucose 4-epimerase
VGLIYSLTDEWSTTKVVHVAKQRVLVTGGAGFIGSTFCDKLLDLDKEVVAFDNLSTGRESFLAEAKKSSSFQLVRGDIRQLDELHNVCNEFKPDLVAHFAANADVRQGLDRPRQDLDYNTIGTWNVAEAARRSGCKNIIFSSTGSVYGEPEIFPTPEDCPFPIQTSLYGASKLAGEGILAAYAQGYQINVTVFRFVSILGPRYTHGHVFDFVKNLRKDSSFLKVLGDGQQLKSYLHIEDLMNGLCLIVKKGMQGYQVFNIGHEDALTVNRSIGYIVNELGLNPRLEYTGGTRGWVGDSPRIQLATGKLKAEGWEAKLNLEQAVRDTVRYLQAETWLFEENT